MMQMTASMVPSLGNLADPAAHDNSELLRMSGAAALQAGNRVAAADLYRKALVHAPADQRLLCDLARVLRELGRFAESVDAFRRAVAGGRASIELLVELGATQAMARKHRAALHTLGRVVSIDPTHADAWSQRGNLLLSMGYPGEALTCHQRAISLSPRSAFAWLHHGYHVLRAGRPASARDSFARAIGFKPDLAVAWVRQADAMAAMGRWRSAFASYEQAVALDGAFLQARLGRARALAALGHCAVANTTRREGSVPPACQNALA